MLNKPCKVIQVGESTIKVYGNNHNIPVIYGHELTEKEKLDFDYHDNIEEDFQGFRYRGRVYDLTQIEKTSLYSPFNGHFHGVTADSFFSGVGVVQDRTGESVKVYTYIS